MGIIVSSFKGCGRTVFENAVNGKVKIFDAVMRLENGLLEGYLERILEVVDHYDVVFINCEKLVHDKLESRHIDYDVFYPSKERRAEFLENQVRKRTKGGEIREMDIHFNKWIDEIDADESEHCYKHKLSKNGEFLLNNQALMDYVNTIIEKNKRSNEESGDNGEQRS